MENNRDVDSGTIEPSNAETTRHVSSMLATYVGPLPTSPDLPPHPCPCECGRLIPDPHGFWRTLTSEVASAVTWMADQSWVGQIPDAVNQLRDATFDLAEALLSWYHDDHRTLVKTHALLLDAHNWRAASTRLAPVLDKLSNPTPEPAAPVTPRPSPPAPDPVALDDLPTVTGDEEVPVPAWAQPPVTDVFEQAATGTDDPAPHRPHLRLITNDDTTTSAHR